MKVYRFYTKPTDEALEQSYDLDVRDKYPLYAFTNNKKYRKIFKESRDVDKCFIEFKSDMSKDEYIQYVNSNRANMLEYYKFRHLVKRGSIPQFNEVKILCTWSEKEICSACSDDSINGIDGELTNHTCPFIYNNKYLNALYKLKYISFWKLFTRIEMPEGFITEDEEEKYLDYSYPEVQFDELNTFINLFGETFKTD